LKRFIPPILLGGFIVALFVAIQGGGSVGLAGQSDTRQVEYVVAQQAAPEPVNWECMAIVHGDGLDGDPYVLETLTFGFDWVVPHQADFFCETAVKTTSSEPTQLPEPRIWVCYAIRRGADPDDPISLLTNNFTGGDGDEDGGADEDGDQVFVRRSTHLCEEGSKTTFLRNGDVDQEFGNSESGIVYQCFTIEGGQDPSQVFWLHTANWGADDVRVRQSNMMCEPAVKYEESGGGTVAGAFPAEPVMQCYRIEGGVRRENVPVRLETLNFDEDDVQMRSATRMCESATLESFIVDFDITLPTIPIGPQP
jgi:hypothetical protein